MGRVFIGALHDAQALQVIHIRLIYGYLPDGLARAESTLLIFPPKE